MVTGLVLMLVLSVQEPTIRNRVSTETVDAGGSVTLTVDVVGRDRDAADFAEQPQFDGFSTSSITRNSVVTYDGGEGRRVTTWSIELRAVTPGTWSVGAVRVTVGNTELEAGPLTVIVREASGLREEGMSGRLHALVEGATGPDGTDQVIVSVVPSSDRIILGEQLDLLVVAWFPRDVRTRLRTRPTLTPPELTGAWTYSQSAALGVFSSRRVEGRDYDVFVHHQVVFPLTPGSFDVGAASVSYNLPVRTSILSREIPQEVLSSPIQVAVVASPETPTGMVSMAAGGLLLSLDVDTARFEEGESATISAALEGRGNVSLWPEPEFRWPPGLRVYPGQTEIEIGGDSGIVAGKKTFTYLVVADSAGAYRIPPAQVEFYNLDDGVIDTVVFPAVRLFSRTGSVPTDATSGRTALAATGRQSLASRFVGGVPPWSWLVIVFGPPIILIGVGLSDREKRRKSGVPVAPERSGLGILEDELRSALRALVPDPRARGERLASALQAAGVETPVAEHAGRVRDRLERVVYGPDDNADADELAAEVRELLNALPLGRSGRAEVLGRAVLLGLVFQLASGEAVRAQEILPEQLYQAGGYLQAADSFAIRAYDNSAEPAHWINLGYALQGAAQPVAARAALLRAARLLPRDRDVRAAVQPRVGPDAVTRRLTRVFLVTPQEALLLAVMVWFGMWGLIFMKRRVRWWPWAILVAGILGYAQYVRVQYHRPIALVALSGTPLRAAPFESATSGGDLSVGAAIEILERSGVWVLVGRGSSSGWVLADRIRRI